MKALIQRVTRAEVRMAGQTHVKIGPGLLVLLGVAKGDRPETAKKLADRTLGLRMFADDLGRMGKSCQEVKGDILVVSQVTLVGDTSRGTRPSLSPAASPDQALALYRAYVAAVGETGLKVKTGVFGAPMEIELVNEGPVTFSLEE